MGKRMATSPPSPPQDADDTSILTPVYDGLPAYGDSEAIESLQSPIARVIEDGRIDLDLPNSLSRLPKSLKAQLTRVSDDVDSRHDNAPMRLGRKPPPLNIVMQVVGSQGDVQPFVALGQALQGYGHRIRIATHPNFRTFVKSHGLEFYSIGGDPAELMAYMVKNPGLFPTMVAIQKGEVHRRRRAMRDMLHAFWKSCFEPTDEPRDTGSRRGDPTPFVADAIIANPPSFAHVHCAEKLGIPLHMLFTMPWSPTKGFPHPLANINAPDTDPKLVNLISYLMIDALIWQGLGDIVNHFRRKTLDLEPLDATQAPGLISKLRIPHTYCWSPSLVAKPTDWSHVISVSGYHSLPEPAKYQPSEALMNFLNSGPPPIYIGFGSIVVDDPAALTQIVLQAVHMAGVRAIISHGWCQLGTGATAAPDINSSSDAAPALDHTVFLLSSCPHHWLFPRVSCVVHHGGAGTTAAGLAAGKPTIVVPFFGDQQFWGNMIHRQGVGPQPLPARELTAEKLAAAITYATNDHVVKTRAAGVKERVGKEDGVGNAVKHSHQCLPDSMFANTHCQTPARLSVWRYVKKGRKAHVDIPLSAVAATVLIKEKLINWDDLKLLRHIEYNPTHHGPHEPLSGAAFAIGDLFYDSFKGMGEICYEFLGAPYASPLKVWKQNQAHTLPSSERATNSKSSAASSSIIPQHRASNKISKSYIPGRYALKGTLRISKAAARAPGAFTLAMARGAHNLPSLWGDRTVRQQKKVTGLGSGVKEGVKELALGLSDGVSGIFVQPVIGFKEDGALGLVKGVGKGLLGTPVKFFAAASGVVGYPLQGLDVAVGKVVKGSDEVWREVRRGRMLQGELEEGELGEDERVAILKWWKEVVMGGGV